jgi:hypothetical protein
MSTHALQNHLGLPKMLQGEGLYPAVWLKNWMSIPALGMVTPYKHLNVHGLMAQWVGYDRDSLHRHQV